MEYIDSPEAMALRPFFAVVREGSFVRAARVLRVQQPAVSKAVRALELRLGVTLLERKKSGVTPTPAGRKVYERALRIFEEMGMLLEEARARRGELEGELWFSAQEHVATYLLPKAVARFRRAHPRVVPRIVTGAAQLMVPELTKGRHEFGLFFKVELSAQLERRTIARAKCQIVVAKDRAKDQVTLTSFIGSREVDDPSTKDFPTLRMLKKARPDTRITISCTSLESHKALVLAGAGVSILPLFVVERELEERRLERVAPDYLYLASLDRVTRRGQELSPAAREMLRFVREELAENTLLER